MLEVRSQKSEEGTKSYFSLEDIKEENSEADTGQGI
jgi:hypothetical protein